MASIKAGRESLDGPEREPEWNGKQQVAGSGVEIGSHSVAANRCGSGGWGRAGEEGSPVLKKWAAVTSRHCRYAGLNQDYMVRAGLERGRRGAGSFHIFWEVPLAVP